MQKPENCPKVTALICTLNEENNLPHVLPKIPDWVDEVLLVDGHSADATVAVARKLCPAINILYQPGRGKGDALKYGIGNATGDSAVTGIVLRGVVDVRGDATVDGTIVSMADPLELGELAGMLDTSIGISDQGGHTIDISPSPDRMLPMGIRTKILMVRDGDSFVELLN